MPTTLDQLPLGELARIVSIDWAGLDPEEAKRLRALGFEAGTEVSATHRGMFGGRDPLSVRLGRMTVALRRVHAQAMTVDVVIGSRPADAVGGAGR